MKDEMKVKLDILNNTKTTANILRDVARGCYQEAAYHDKMNSITGFILMVVVLLATLGYTINAFDVVSMLGGDVSTEFIIRAIGLVYWPIGAIAGYF